MDDGSVFRLEPAAVSWLADTFEEETPQRALLDSLALSAEARAGADGPGHVDGDMTHTALFDLIPQDEVQRIAGGVAAAYPALPIPSEPGLDQFRAIDEVIRGQ